MKFIERGGKRIKAFAVDSEVKVIIYDNIETLETIWLNQKEAHQLAVELLLSLSML